MIATCTQCFSSGTVQRFDDGTSGGSRLLCAHFAHKARMALPCPKRIDPAYCRLYYHNVGVDPRFYSCRECKKVGKYDGPAPVPEPSPVPATK